MAAPASTGATPRRERLIFSARAYSIIWSAPSALSSGSPSKFAQTPPSERPLVFCSLNFAWAHSTKRGSRIVSASIVTTWSRSLSDGSRRSHAWLRAPPFLPVLSTVSHTSQPGRDSASSTVRSVLLSLTTIRRSGLSVWLSTDSIAATIPACSLWAGISSATRPARNFARLTTAPASGRIARTATSGAVMA